MSFLDVLVDVWLVLLWLFSHIIFNRGKLDWWVMMQLGIKTETRAQLYIRESDRSKFEICRCVKWSRWCTKLGCTAAYHTPMRRRPALSHPSITVVTWTQLSMSHTAPVYPLHSTWSRSLTLRLSAGFSSCSHFCFYQSRWRVYAQGCKISRQLFGQRRWDGGMLGK